MGVPSDQLTPSAIVYLIVSGSSEIFSYDPNDVFFTSSGVLL